MRHLWFTVYHNGNPLKQMALQISPLYVCEIMRVCLIRVHNFVCGSSNSISALLVPRDHHVNREKGLGKKYIEDWNSVSSSWMWHFLGFFKLYMCTVKVKWLSFRVREWFSARIYRSTTVWICICAYCLSRALMITLVLSMFILYLHIMYVKRLDIIVARQVLEISTISSAYSRISMCIKIVSWSTQFLYVVKYLIYIKT